MQTKTSLDTISQTYNQSVGRNLCHIRSSHLGCVWKGFNSAPIGRSSYQSSYQIRPILDKCLWWAWSWAGLVKYVWLGGWPDLCGSHAWSDTVYCKTVSSIHLCTIGRILCVFPLPPTWFCNTFTQYMHCTDAQNILLNDNTVIHNSKLCGRPIDGHLIVSSCLKVNRDISTIDLFVVCAIESKSIQGKKKPY